MAATSKQVEAIRKVREAAEADLYTFIQLVAPYRDLGDIHHELLDWWNKPDSKDSQLVLMPRDHQKSAMMAYRVAWTITRNPTVTILYISATATLATRQLAFIKQILTSKTYRTYWPEMIEPEEGKRALWNVNEIMVDHPDRAKYGIRDATITACGINKIITGLHYDINVLDDVVVAENSATMDARSKLAADYSLLASIATTGAKEWVVGTRYHPKDLYAELLAIKETTYDEDGNPTGSLPVYEVFERVLEDSPSRDGTGTYLWPRAKSPTTGKWRGFDIAQRARKYAKYVDKAQFFSQYYNDPTDSSNMNVSVDKFQYYNREGVKRESGVWYFGRRKLNVYAAVDFAYSITAGADYTAIVVIGMASNGDVYVLDIDRFKTDRPSEILDRMVRIHSKWSFKKIRAEVNGPQKGVVNLMKEKMAETNRYFSIDEYSVSRASGNKEERFHANLYPRYDDLRVWHYRDPMINILEDEILSTRPAHDDVKDALLNAIDIAIPPAEEGRKSGATPIASHPRFGGLGVRI